ncbi:hypothetical protein MSC49_23810 [Methylosinus sp. C49]|uniref:DUF3142 domain-containing protein n=1 Tax=Methylosinus sp. C49 TaxID=2699395 RepID=UPI001366B1C4|nr:DUF3142 domain-containing protein [Methylosinus sp. C49]BBU62446.1 hypothetical protein MSC49_23810 [Methylosinus sp. C49]
MRARAFLLALCALLSASAAGAEPLVRAADHDAFWLWAGVKRRAELATAKTIYLHSGEIGPDRDGFIRMKAQGGVEPGPHKAALWLAYRVRSLDWPPEIVAQIRRRLEAWRAQPGGVAGVQIDFDASTRGLQNYAAFLRTLRRELPRGCALGVTGLMDWASQAAPEDLNALSGSVDELVFQTYKGAQTVENIDAYVARLSRLRIPFRLGLAEGARWAPPAALAERPNFLGYVVFLRNRAAP